MFNLISERITIHVSLHYWKVISKWRTPAIIGTLPTYGACSLTCTYHMHQRSQAHKWFRSESQQCNLLDRIRARLLWQQQWVMQGGIIQDEDRVDQAEQLTEQKHPENAVINWSLKCLLFLLAIWPMALLNKEWIQNSLAFRCDITQIYGGPEGSQHACNHPNTCRLRKHLQIQKRLSLISKYVERERHNKTEFMLCSVRLEVMEWISLCGNEIYTYNPNPNNKIS